MCFCSWLYGIQLELGCRNSWFLCPQCFPFLWKFSFVVLELFVGSGEQDKGYLVSGNSVSLFFLFSRKNVGIRLLYEKVAIVWLVLQFCSWYTYFFFSAICLFFGGLFAVFVLHLFLEIDEWWILNILLSLHADRHLEVCRPDIFPEIFFIVGNGLNISDFVTVFIKIHWY